MFKRKLDTIQELKIEHQKCKNMKMYIGITKFIAALKYFELVAFILLVI